MRKLAMLSLSFALFAQPALADDLEGSSDETEQVIPPTVVDNQAPTALEPLDLDDIDITTKTPADEFITATTPLLLALMFGSVGLVAFTLISQSKRDSARLD